MKKCFVLAQRNLKETIRDPLSIVFCLGFPLFMLLLMQLIFTNLDVGAGAVPANFDIENYASGICVFGYTFIGLCVANAIAEDKNTAFIKRIDISPLGKFGYYASFFLAALPVALAQTVLFFSVALLFGFPPNGRFFLSILYLLPSAVLYICVGILIGCVCKNEKQTGPISSVFVSLTGILGGVFMPVDLFRGGFATFVRLLPFGHSVAVGSELQTVGARCIYPHILYLLFYIVLLAAIVAVVEGVRSRRK